MPSKTRILIVGHSPTLPSGMAETLRLVFEPLIKKYPNEYEIFQLGLFHYYAVSQPQWEIFPTLCDVNKAGERNFHPNDISGEMSFPEDIGRVKPDIVFAFNDPQNLLHLCQPPQLRSYKLVLYVNFDGYPIPDQMGPILDNADLIITVSYFAADVIRKYLPAVQTTKLCTMYCPADTERFAPLTSDDKKQLRSDCFPSWMPQEAFVVGWNGRNQWRKQIWLAYEVISVVRNGGYLVCDRCYAVDLDNIRYEIGNAKRNSETKSGDGVAHPNMKRCNNCGGNELSVAEPLSNIFLWNHMAKDDPQADWPLDLLEFQYQVKEGHGIHYTEGLGMRSQLSPADMPCLYQMWDCLLFLSGGEGFGMPAWEAMASGIPIVYSDHTSHAEFLNQANAGIPVGGILQPQMGNCIRRMIANSGSAVAAVRRLYLNRKQGLQFGNNGRKFVDGYNLNAECSRWHHLLKNLKPCTAGDGARE